MKAAWNGYQAEVNKLIEDVESIPAYHKCLVECVRVASRRDIPRGCQTEYVPGLTDKSKVYMKLTSASIQAVPLTTVP